MLLPPVPVSGLLLTLSPCVAVIGVYQVMREAHTELKEHPEDGCYIRGLYIEGCRWDPARYQLTESRPKELYTDMPCIWLMPMSNRPVVESGMYDCPVYKTLTRAGMYRSVGLSHIAGLHCTRPDCFSDNLVTGFFLLIKVLKSLAVQGILMS